MKYNKFFHCILSLLFLLGSALLCSCNKNPMSAMALGMEVRSKSQPKYRHSLNGLQNQKKNEIPVELSVTEEAAGVSQSEGGEQCGLFCRFRKGFERFIEPVTKRASCIIDPYTNSQYNNSTSSESELKEAQEGLKKCQASLDDCKSNLGFSKDLSNTLQKSLDESKKILLLSGYILSLS